MQSPGNDVSDQILLLHDRHNDSPSQQPHDGSPGQCGRDVRPCGGLCAMLCGVHKHGDESCICHNDETGDHDAHNDHGGYNDYDDRIDHIDEDSCDSHDHWKYECLAHQF